MDQIYTRYSTALTLLKPMNQGNSEISAINPTLDIIKTANGISNAPGSAAKQASGVAFTFTVSQSQRDAVQKGDEPGSIIIAGIGGGDAVERFDSWEALEARIRTDGTMDGSQKNHWLEQASSLQESSKELREFQSSDRYIGLKSGAVRSAMEVAVRNYLAESTSVADIKNSLGSAPIRNFLRNAEG